MADAARRTTSRQALGRHAGFEEVSPEVGQLDEAAFDDELEADPDEALSLLADLTGATDQHLRDLARRLAGRVVVDVVRTGAPRRRGIGRLRHAPADRSHGELDLDRGLETLAAARALGVAPALDELHAREWSRPDLALCLLVDRSGSMGGARLATAAVAAAACLWRAPLDTSVVAFGDEAVVLAAQGSGRAPESVVEDLFRAAGPRPHRSGPGPAGRPRASSTARRPAGASPSCSPTPGPPRAAIRWPRRPRSTSWSCSAPPVTAPRPESWPTTSAPAGSRSPVRARCPMPSPRYSDS